MKRSALLTPPGLLLACLLVLAAGCNNPKSPRGFSLPDGDVQAGEATFVELGCQSCHEVIGTDLPRPEGAPLAVKLGGATQRVRTYGELVTSIINPSHRLAPGYPSAEIANAGTSKMTVYNDVLTVTQLIDLVAFLESHYELQQYVPTEYPMLP